ncbi:ABC transporter ATP-binding protein [Corynebacterium suranareeae]|uniref:ABC transporter ATP-binding protein n=1 Tax=Corynebacterium suranareeae TaxID=2506452 RepID=A0A160PPL9_9CORY|nr:ABC transporter ATP-binding protein [Corynebacterium suranareeae]BAU95977.1 ABC transporter ATP-binding protein [Corynebacterium suranareeae]
MIHASNLRHSFGNTVVIDGVSLHVPAHGVVSLVGPNGSGKTTLLRTLYGALQPDQGDVHLNDVALGSLPRKEIAKTMAVVIQEHDSDLPMTVADLVLLGRLPYQKLFAGQSESDQQRVQEALTHVGALHLATRKFGALSGGERQRVLIARALVQDATHILLDEPTNHLDIRYQHEVLHLIRELSSSSVVVLHDLNLAAAYSDHIILLNEGRIITQGTPSEVLTPESLEPVYGVRVERFDLDGEVHLRFKRH